MDEVGSVFYFAQVKRNELFVELLSRNTSKEEYLFNETRAYVLTMINDYGCY
jgi:hypothetical protein